MMRYVILTTTGYRTSDGLVSRFLCDAQIFTSKETIRDYSGKWDCQEGELILDVESFTLVGSIDSLGFILIPPEKTHWKL